MASDLTTFPLQTKKYSELASYSNLDGSEIVNIVNGGTNKKTTIDDINTYVESQQQGLAQYYMTNNATATTIAVSGTYYKIAGTTTAGVTPVNFTLSDNRASYDLAVANKFKVTAICSITSGSNKNIHLRIAKNGVTQTRSEQKVSTSGTGKADNITVKDIVELSAATDFIEIFISNASDTTAITVVDLHVIIEKLF